MTGLLAGKVVVVSGVGPGLGKAICARMADNGATVVLAARTESRLTDIAAPSQPTRDTILQLDEKQSARTEFSDLYGGLYSGIAWDW